MTTPQGIEDDIDGADDAAAQDLGLMPGQEPPKAAPPPPVKKPATTKAAPAKAASAPAGGAPNNEALAGPLVSVVTRNEFYRDGFRNMMRLAVLEGIIIIGLILAIIVYMTTAKPNDRYFATTADGRIMQLVPLDRPNMNVSALMSWVAQAVSETMTFGYHDYQRRLQQSSRHFTRRGWESFATALQRAKIIDSVTTTQQVVTAEPRSAPILENQGVINGKYRWIIRLPIRVTYRAGTQSRTDDLTVTLVVDRVPSLENPAGVGIEQWIAKSG